MPIIVQTILLLHQIFFGDSALASSVGVSSTGFNVLGASFSAADTNRDGRLDQSEFQQFIQGGLH